MNYGCHILLLHSVSLAFEGDGMSLLHNNLLWKGKVGSIFFGLRAPKSDKTIKGFCVTAAFNSSKAFWHLVHSHDLLFFNSSAAFAENTLMNRR